MGIIAYRFGFYGQLLRCASFLELIGLRFHPSWSCLHGVMEREGSKDGSGVRSSQPRVFSHVCWACLALLLLPLSQLAPFLSQLLILDKHLALQTLLQNALRRTQPPTAKKEGGFLSCVMVLQGLSTLTWGDDGLGNLTEAVLPPSEQEQLWVFIGRSHR